MSYKICPNSGALFCLLQILLPDKRRIILALRMDCAYKDIPISKSLVINRLGLEDEHKPSLLQFAMEAKEKDLNLHHKPAY